MTFETFRTLVLVIHLTVEGFNLYGGMRALSLSLKIHDPSVRTIVRSFAWAALAGIGRSIFWLSLLFFSELFGTDDITAVPVVALSLLLLLLVSAAVNTWLRIKIFLELTGEGVA